MSILYMYMYICVCSRPQVFWIIKQISIQSMSKTEFIVPTSYGCENTTTLTSNAHAFYKSEIQHIIRSFGILNMKGAFTMMYVVWGIQELQTEDNTLCKYYMEAVTSENINEKLSELLLCQRPIAVNPSPLYGLVLHYGQFS